MKKTTPIILTSWICLASLLAGAQEIISVTIKGSVTESTAKPVSLASVEVFRQADSSRVAAFSSNTNGSFEWKGKLSEGNYWMRISYTGYQPFRISDLRIKGNGELVDIGTITLVPSSAALSVVTVTGKKSLIEQKPGMMLMNVEGSISASGMSVSELLEKAPGVMVDREGNISLQGRPGVAVYIDGRPTYLSNSDLSAMLKNLPADAVATIEFITSPSAKYDAAGNAGIINIKTKKSKATGTNGSLNLGAGYGKFAKTNSGLMLNYRNSKVNLYGHYNYQYNRRFKSLCINRSNLLNGEQTDFRQRNREEKENNNHTIKLGADYNIARRSVIGILYNGTLNREHQWNESSNSIGVGQQVDSSLLSHIANRPRLDNHLFNLNLKHKLDSSGTEWAVDADLGIFRNREHTGYRNVFLDAAMIPYREDQLLRSQTPNKVTIKSIKSDLSNIDFKWMKVEMGLKAAEVITSNNILFEQFDGNAWQNDISRTNDFRYEERVLAGYMNAEYKIGKVRYQWGIRMEHTRSKGVSLTTQKTVTRRYTDWFPGIQLEYALRKDHQLSFNYNKRIQRPNYQTLNPFIYFLDQYGYMLGNPYLNPQYSHSMDIGYLWKNKYLVKAGVTFTNGLISEVLLPDTTRKAIYQTFENLGSQKIWSITLSAPVTVGRWWSSQNSINGIYLHTRSDNLKGQRLDAGKFFVMINTNNSFSIGGGWNAELNARYTSTIVYSTVKIDPVFTMDGGVSKSILKNQGSIRLSLSDVLDTQEQFVQSVYPGFNYQLCQKPETRIVRIGFSYRFGNKNVKAARARLTGMEAEQERLKKDGQ